MKKNFLKIIIAVFFLLLHAEVEAQSTNQKLKPILTADSLATGNWKDVLTSFFQLSFDRFIGQSKELNFQSNPYAILLRANPDAAIDRNYRKYSVLRKLNFGFGLKLDSSYRFNGFSSGFRYALKDDRDATVSKWLFEQVRKDPYREEVRSLNRFALRQILQEFPDQDNEKRQELLESLHSLTTDKSFPFKNFDSSFKRIITTVIRDNNLVLVNDFITRKPEVSILTQQDSVINEFKNELKNALLWTVSLTDTTYKDQFFFSNILLKTELMKAIGRYKAGSNWELNMQAGVNFVDDSTSKSRDLKRLLFRFEPGFNWVFRNKANDQSFFEMKFSGSYIHNFGNLYLRERQDSVTINTTLRIRLLGDIWLPLEIKYNPQSGNVFGFLNVRANFTGLNKFLKS